MELSPRMYKLFVRPNWVSKIYIKDIISPIFDFNNRNVLDFGCGIGSNCNIFNPDNYIGIDCDESRIIYASKLYSDFQFKTLENNTFPVGDNWADFILISSVLHHIPTEHLKLCIEEFRRVLSPSGTILILEPVLVEGSNINNHYMTYFDKGKFIRNEHEYLELFSSSKFETKVLKKYTQLLLYNKIFFTAQPI